MRAIWSGAISFGLVNIPVRLYSATGDSGLSFDMLAKDDLSPIKYKRVASSDGREVPYKEIVKGFKIDKDKYVVMSDEDFEKASVKRTKSIEIFNFVNENEIDPIYFDKPYFLEPDKNAAKPYALLREALKKSKRVGVANFLLRNREHLAILKPVGDVVLLNQMRYHADIRRSSDLNLPEQKIISAKEVDMAVKLIDQLTEKFNPEEYKDTYVDELMKIIEAKAEGKSIKIKEEAIEPTKVKDLMDVLKASLESTKGKPKERPPVKAKTVRHKAKTKNS